MAAALDPAPLRILFVGGTGTISASAVRRAAASGMDVTVLNRGRTTKRALPESVSVLTADVADADSVTAALGSLEFDAVVNFLIFGGADAAVAVDTYADRTRQYVHISSASVYGKPVLSWPITESTQVHNRFVPYARDKIAAERVFESAFAERGFPVTIVRPSHTYDDQNPPLPGDWTVIDRIARGLEVPVHGDGTSLWTLTHAEDVAVGLVGLLANNRAIGETFHITGDELYTWDGIYDIVAEALGTRAKLVHIPSELWTVGAPDWFWSELFRGDLGHSAVFDNSKIRRAVPAFDPTLTFPRAVRRMLSWRAEHPELTAPDAATSGILDRMTTGFHQSEELFASLAPRSAEAHT